MAARRLRSLPANSTRCAVGLLEHGEERRTTEMVTSLGHSHSISSDPIQDSNNRAGPKLVPISSPLVKRSLDARRLTPAGKGEHATATCIDLRVISSQLAALLKRHSFVTYNKKTSVGARPFRLSMLGRPGCPLLGPPNHDLKITRTLKANRTIT